MQGKANKVKEKTLNKIISKQESKFSNKQFRKNEPDET